MWAACRIENHMAFKFRFFCQRYGQAKSFLSSLTIPPANTFRKASNSIFAISASMVATHILCMALETSTDVWVSMGTAWSADVRVLAWCCWLTPKPATDGKRKEINTKDERRFSMIAVDFGKIFLWLLSRLVAFSQWAVSVFQSRYYRGRVGS